MIQHAALQWLRQDIDQEFQLTKYIYSYVFCEDVG